MRDEVQRWLSACIVAGYDMPDGDNSHASFEVDAPTLEALCRRWLEVEDAQIREVEEEMHGLVIRAHPLQKGQRVRIVPEAGQGVA